MFSSPRESSEVCGLFQNETLAGEDEVAEVGIPAEDGQELFDIRAVQIVGVDVRGWQLFDLVFEDDLTDLAKLSKGFFDAVREPGRSGDAGLDLVRVDCDGDDRSRQ